jgi:dTDP-4-dehydrorhamnose reductase
MLKNKKILIAGAQGQLGQEFQVILRQRNIPFIAPEEGCLDISKFDQAREYLERARVDIVINCAAYNDVDSAQDNKDLVYLINTEAVQNLAEICRDLNLFFVHFSSDYVFDGTQETPYAEDDPPNPLNAYGLSKLDGERRVQAILENYLIFRLSWVFGNGQQNFLYKLNEWLRDKDELKITDDEISVPTYTEDVVDIVLLAIEKNVKGLYHLTNSGQCSRFELAQYYVKQMGLIKRLIPVSLDEFPARARRPKNSRMSNEKICKLLNTKIPTWQSGIDRQIARNLITREG